VHTTVARGSFVVQGSVLVGPGLHFWYSFIGRTVTATGTAGKLPTCNKAITTPDQQQLDNVSTLLTFPI